MSFNYVIGLLGSIFTTVALALERLSAMKVSNPRQQQRFRRRQVLQRGPDGQMEAMTTTTTSTATCINAVEYPLLKVVLSILIFSVCFNLPRFFEMRFNLHEESSLRKVNDTGQLHLDHALVTVSTVKSRFNESQFNKVSILGTESSDRNEISL